MGDLASNAYFIQLLGFVALVFGVAAFWHKHDSGLKKLLVGQSIALCIHFWLLGAEAAAMVAMVAAGRNAAALFGNMKKFAPVFMVLYIVLGLYRYHAWVDALPVTAAVLGTVAIFYMAELRMRLTMLLATTLWIVHNFVVASWGPFLMEVLLFGANAVRCRSLHRQAHAADA